MNPTRSIATRWASAAICLSLIALTQSALGQNPSPRQERVRGFVAAFNSGDAAATARFLADNATPTYRDARPFEERRELFAQMIGELGRLEIRGMQLSGDTARVRVAASETEDSVVLLFGFEPGEPYRVVSLGIDRSQGLPDGIPEPPSREGRSEAEYRQAVESYFAELAAEDRFAGVVLIAEEGQPIVHRAYGLADRSWEVPNRLSTRFNVGSINKDFTKVAIAQLMAAGKLRLTDTIADHLPSYPNREVAEKVTIQHLLDHSSGLGDIFVPEFFNGAKTRFRENEDYFPLFAGEPLLFEPGAGRRYSNGGYIVLGAIVSAASGMPYSDYIEQKVFEPAGMAASLFVAYDEVQPEISVPYTKQGAPEGGWKPARHMLPIRGMGAGSAFATAADLLAFDRALRGHVLLEPRYTHWFFTGELLAEGEASREPARFPVGLAGGAPGINAILEGDGQTVVIVVSNQDPPAAEAIGVALGRDLLSRSR